MYIKYEISCDRFFVSSDESACYASPDYSGIEYSRYIPIDISMEEVNEYLLKFPHEACVELTNKCNFNCPFCIASATSTDNRFLSLDEFSRILNILPRQICRLTLTGGEPLLHPQLDKIIDLAIGKGFSVVLSTNGFNSDKLEFLTRKRNNIIVAISLHGPKTIHDNYVKVQGAYDKSILSIKAAISNSCYVHVYSTASRDNVNYLIELTGILEEYKIVEHRINIVKNKGRIEGDIIQHSQIKSSLPIATTIKNQSIKTTSSPFLFISSEGKMELRNARQI